MIDFFVLYHCTPIDPNENFAAREYSVQELEILRNYYGSDVYINTAAEIEGVPVSWPGFLLEIGSSGAPVRTIQEQLSLIRETYSNIPSFEIDGIYGEDTLLAVKKFQEIFNLNESGLVDYSTWYKISEIYVALAKLSRYKSKKLLHDKIICSIIIAVRIAQINF